MQKNWVFVEIRKDFLLIVSKRILISEFVVCRRSSIVDKTFLIKKIPYIICFCGKPYVLICKMDATKVLYNAGKKKKNVSYIMLNVHKRHFNNLLFKIFMAKKSFPLILVKKVKNV